MATLLVCEFIHFKVATIVFSAQGWITDQQKQFFAS